MAVVMPEVGSTFESREAVVSSGDIADFARLWDPQPMHFDEEAGVGSVFGRLVASGWHTAALTMRLAVQADILGGRPYVGLEVKALKFETPVTPGDSLRVTMRVLAARTTSDGARGILRLAVDTHRGDGVRVLSQEWTMLVTPGAVDSAS